MLRSAGTVVATTFCKRQLACVRALQESLAELQPGARLVAVVLDDPHCVIDPRHEPFNLLRPEDLIPDVEVAGLVRDEDVAPLALAVRTPVEQRLATHDVRWLPADALVVGALLPADPDSGWVQPGDDAGYLDVLSRHGHAALREIPFGRGLLARADYIGDLIRRADSERRSARGSADAEGLLAWLRAPAPLANDPTRSVNRFLAILWEVRPDLQAQFPDLAGEDGPRLAEWAWRWGAVHDALPEELLPRRPDPTDLARPIDAPPAPPRLRGVNVVGLLERELGLGEAARYLVAALDDAGIELLPIEPRSTQGPLRPTAVGSTLDPRDAVFDITLLCLNGEMIPHLVQEVGPEFFRRFTAALWFWEVGPPPVSWFADAHLLDEIWAATSFIADALRPVSPVPVLVVPQAVEVGTPPPLDRAGFDIDETAFAFLYLFDHSSDLRRKNPDGLIDAYSRAFPDDGRTTLVLKSLNADRHPDERDRLRVAASRRRDVRIIEARLEPSERDALIAGCDAYVSLHRSEGFGLTLAEAMLHGRPVIATRYGGNLDVMNDANSLLVDVSMVPVGPGSIYPADGVWAEPDLDHAAECLRAVVSDPSAALDRATRAEADVRDRHSVQAVGTVLRGELSRIRSVLDDQGRPPAAPAAHERQARAAGLALATSRRLRRRVDELEARLQAR